MALFGAEAAPSDFTPVADVPCQQMANYAAAVQTQVSSVHKHSKSYIDRHRAIGTSMTGFGLALTQLANCESSTNTSLAKGISSMGLCVGRLSATYSELAERETATFEEPMREYIRVLSAVKAAISARDAALRTYNSTSSLRLAKQVRLDRPRRPSPKPRPDPDPDPDPDQERLDKLRSSGGKDEKISQLQREVREAEEASNLAKSEYESVASRVDTEMARFQQEKLSDFKRIVSGVISRRRECQYSVACPCDDLPPLLSH